ncbi:MAG: alpha/beta hydrolase [Xenococcus sp. (in: cyanobacteria)]
MNNKTKFGIIALVTAFLLSLLTRFWSPYLLAQDSSPVGTWTLASRILPPPVGASKNLRDFLATIPQPDPDAMRSIPLETDADWLTLIKQINANNAAKVPGLLEKFSVSVENAEIEGVPIHYVNPVKVDPKHEEHLFVYVHGGAYVFNAGEAGLPEAILIASRLQIPVLSIDYRMPPEHQFPAGLDDVVTVWKHLLSERSARSMALGGTSAGGGLILSSVHKFKQLDLDLPGALYAGTPWADLTRTGDSLFTNEGVDWVLVTYDGLLKEAAQLYAGETELTDPLISPIYGDFEEFPPTFLVTGTRDLFLSDTARVDIALRQAGVISDIIVFEAVSHADYIALPDSPESELTYDEMNNFLLQHLKR